MSKKRGRPEKVDTKKGRIMVRLSEDDVKMLNFIVASSGESKSKVIRSGLKMMYNLEKVRSLTD